MAIPARDVPRASLPSRFGGAWMRFPGVHNSQTGSGGAATSSSHASGMPRGAHMLAIVALLTTATAVVTILRMRVPGGVNDARLGWMSEQWLAEHRASRRP